MKEYLDLIRKKINSIFDFLNNLQRIIGVKTSTDNSIFGKLNNLKNTIQNIQVPTYNVQKLVLNGDHFTVDYPPINDICMNDEVVLYHPDGGTLVWEGVSFNGKVGQLDGAGNAFDGWSIKIQYFYMSQI